MTAPLDQSQIEAMLKQSPFISFLGLTVTALDAGKQEVVMRAPMRPEFECEPGTRQWHGGPIASIIDTVGDYALVMFVGQVDRSVREREAFQELDYRAVFGSLTKWTVEIDDPARVPELVQRAFHTAAAGRPGPVVVALPHDTLVERIAVADAPPFVPLETAPGVEDMAEL